jgi:hypothetical protein
MIKHESEIAMSAKRPVVDLMALTSEQALPMPEAVQRSAPPSVATVSAAAPARQPAAATRKSRGVSTVEHVPTANLEALAFKVPPSFRKRFRSRAAETDQKLNELLFAAFEAWEEKHGFKK